MAPGGDYESIRGLANKLAEHAARIAGVLVLVDDIAAKEIGPSQLEAGFELVRYYAAEALRLHAAGMDDPDLLLAQRLLGWLQTWQGPVSLPDIYRNGPRAIPTPRPPRRSCGSLRSISASSVSQMGPRSAVNGGASSGRGSRHENSECGYAKAKAANLAKVDTRFRRFRNFRIRLRGI
jgi:hypothetical protein